MSIVFAAPTPCRHRAATFTEQVAAGCCLLILTLLLLAGAVTPALADHYLPLHRVLLLNSYHRGYAWSDSIEAAIRDKLAQADNSLDFTVEYLDSKRFPTGLHFSALEALILEKYRDHKPDVLIVADNPALQFVLTRRARLFPGVPVVFCGINDFSDDMLAGQTRITGVIEELDMAGTIDQILRLHPMVGQIAIITDSSELGRMNRQRFRQASGPFRDRVNFIELSDLSHTELAAQLPALPRNTVILHTAMIRDRNGIQLSAQGSIDLLTENTDLPFYGMAEHAIGSEAVGGIVTSAALQGENAAAMALRILRGEAPEQIPVLRNSPTRPVFNYPALQRYGIDEKLLPPGSEVRNRPPSFYRDYPGPTVLAGLGFALLVTLVIALLVNVLKRRQAIMLLRTRRNQLQQIIESMPVGVFLADRHGQIVMSNSAGSRIWGGEKQVGIDEYTAYRGWWADSGQPIAAEEWGLARAIRNGETSLDELIDIETFDGQRKTILNSTLPLRDTKGNVIGGLAVIQDVTERLRTENTLRTLANEWQNTFNAVRDAIVILDKDFRILHSNQAFSQLVEKEPQAILGRHCWELVHHGTEPFHSCPYARMLESGQGETSEYCEGDHYWETRVDPIFDDDGKLCGAIHIIADITERKQAEQLLAERERTLALLFHEMRSGFALHEIICDDAGIPCDYRFLMVNSAFEELTGLKGAEIIGRTVREVHPTLESLWIERYGQVALTGKSTEFESYSTRFDRHFGVRAYSPEPGKFAALFNDITDRWRAEQELKSLLEQFEQRNTELEQFTYSVSHDLKSPLVTISGFVGQLREDLARDNRESVAIDLDFIESSTAQMGVLLNNLLHLARSGRVIGDPLPIDLAGTARAALELARGQLDKHTVRIDLADDLPMVSGDADRLREVFQNLIENAAKFSREQPSPWIEIGGKLDGQQVLCWVRDNGIGIAPQYLEKIFGLFERLGRSEQGTGIGLSLARRIIEKHGGRIWAESAGEDQGSTFYFTLPIA